MTHSEKLAGFARARSEAPRLVELGYKPKDIAWYLRVSVGTVRNALRTEGKGRWKWGDGVSSRGEK
jgi:hypothetical protein